MIAAHHTPQSNIFQICVRPQHIPSELLETPQSNILNFDWPAVWRRESDQGWASLSRSLFNLLQTISVMFMSTIPNSFCETQSVDCYHHIWTINLNFAPMIERNWSNPFMHDMVEIVTRRANYFDWLTFSRTTILKVDCWVTLRSHHLDLSEGRKENLNL